MFNPDGGFQNVALALINFIAIVGFAWVPTWFVVKRTDTRVMLKHVVAVLLGLLIYSFLFYVANPSLTFWVVK